MHIMPSFSVFRHHLHDGSMKLAHYTGHLLHEKTFWAFVGIVTIIVVLFSILLLLGNDAAIEHQAFPYPM